MKIAARDQLEPGKVMAQRLATHIIQCQYLWRAINGSKSPLARVRAEFPGEYPAG